MFAILAKLGLTPPNGCWPICIWSCLNVVCVAEVARSPCVEAGLVRPLLVLLKDGRSVQCQIQAGRALGNICYENGQYSPYILNLKPHLGTNCSRISIDIIIYFMCVGSNHISCHYASGCCRALARIQKLPVQNVHFSASLLPISPIIKPNNFTGPGQHLSVFKTGRLVSS